MSAFLCLPEHIQAITRYAVANGILYDVDPFTLATVLAKENIRSVEYRYPDVKGHAARDFFTVPYASNEAYIAACGEPWKPGVPRLPVESDLSPVEAVKLVDSLEYQSCETPDWENTEAYKWLNAIARRAARRIDPAGYDKAAWAL